MSSQTSGIFWALWAKNLKRKIIQIWPKIYQILVKFETFLSFLWGEIIFKHFGKYFVLKSHKNSHLQLKLNFKKISKFLMIWQHWIEIKMWRDLCFDFGENWKLVKNVKMASNVGFLDWKVNLSEKNVILTSFLCERGLNFVRN